ncbi:helix-turn-helix domain-containing protein [Phascolarctobacterium faecium]|jgi:immunity repressor protein|uniref:helix-turn-helix domain-containing protein n=1 Tax=Phascolarctobacterium faecium TaxID=33025 RepID=UPI003AEF2F66
MINKLSEFVRTKRGNMSLREFAKLCENISHTQIDSIERGIDPRTSKPVRPTVETLSKIAKGTGVSVAYLAALANGDDFTGDEEPKKKIPKDLKKLLNEEEITLNGRMVSPEDKEKMLRIIEALYYDAKEENKRKS